MEDENKTPMNIVKDVAFCVNRISKVLKELMGDGVAECINEQNLKTEYGIGEEITSKLD